MKEVDLSLYEMQSAAHLGILRCLESKKLGQEWGHGLKTSLNDKFAKSISGSMAEMAVCSKMSLSSLSLAVTLIRIAHRIKYE